MSSKRNVAAVVLSLLLLCNLGVIWGNSLLGPADSRNLSRQVLQLVPDTIENLFSTQDQLLYVVRKAAHFTEYACLGGLACGLLAALRKVKSHPFFHLWAGGLFVAAIDETIQIFTGRGSQLQDVWLDFAGFSVGLLAVLLGRTMVSRSNRNDGDNMITSPTSHQSSRKS